MSKNHTIEYKDGITYIKFSRKPSYSEIQCAIDDIAENFPYELRLWDFSNITFDLSMEEIKNIAQYGKIKFVKPNKMAVVAPQDLAFGEVRAFEVYREQEHAIARAFRTKQEALVWLESQRQ